MIIFSKDVGEHLSWLDTVLKRLRKAGLKLKPYKCRLFQQEVLYRVHVVSDDGIKTDPAEIEAIKNWSVPKGATDVRAALGMFGYYRKFIRDYRKKARPLSKLLKKNVSFSWGKEQQKDWTTLKDELVTAPIFAYPDPDLPFILNTDASVCGIGVVLSQVQEGKERVIAYGSRCSAVLMVLQRGLCESDQERPESEVHWES